MNNPEKVKYIGRYESNEYGEHIVYLEYKYRGYKYTVYENRNKGNEPLSWQHKNEQGRIDRLIDIEECEKGREKVPHTTVEDALNKFFEYLETGNWKD